MKKLELSWKKELAKYLFANLNISNWMELYELIENCRNIKGFKLLKQIANCKIEQPNKEVKLCYYS